MSGHLPEMNEKRVSELPGDAGEETTPRRTGGGPRSTESTGRVDFISAFPSLGSSLDSPVS